MAEYPVGALVRVEASFATSGGVPADPTGVALRYRVGSGAAVVLVYGTDAAVIRDSTGKYYVDLTLTSAMVGKLVKYRWEATGAVQAASESEFRVAPSAFY